MSALPRISLQLQVRQLLELRLSGLRLDELKAHATSAQMLLLALVQESAVVGFKSQGDRAARKRLAELLDAHLAEVYDLIEDRQVEAAWAEQEAAARLVGLSQPSRGAQP